MRTDRIISSIPKEIDDGECPNKRGNISNACPISNNHSNINTNSTEGSSETAEASRNWVYPSPKMFWDAMNRKGTLPSHLSDPNSSKTKEELEWIVTIHNVVNEQCWQEICKWEHFRMEGCKVMGDVSRLPDEAQNSPLTVPVLQRFLGRPNDLSPRAWFKSTILGYRRPFDRHDWYIRGGNPNENDNHDPPRRYIIDFYAGNDKNGTASSSFYLDVRPAMDTFDAVRLRVSKYFCEKVKEIKQVFNK